MVFYMLIEQTKITNVLSDSKTSFREKESQALIMTNIDNLKNVCVILALQPSHLGRWLIFLLWDSQCTETFVVLSVIMGHLFPAVLRTDSSFNLPSVTMRTFCEYMSVKRDLFGTVSVRVETQTPSCLTFFQSRQITHIEGIGTI